MFFTEKMYDHYDCLLYGFAGYSLASGHWAVALLFVSLPVLFSVLEALAFAKKSLEVKGN